MLGRVQLWTPPQPATASGVRRSCRPVSACLQAPQAVKVASCPRRLPVSSAHHRRQLSRRRLTGDVAVRATPEAAEAQQEQGAAMPPGAPVAGATLSDAEWAQANGYSADGLGVVALDASLEAHKPHLQYRWQKFLQRRRELENAEGGLHQFSLGFHTFGFNRHNGAIFYREWAPAATGASLIGDFNSWNPTSHPMERDTWGVWTVRLPDLPDGSPAIPHGSKVKVQLRTRDGGAVDRIPAWIRYATAEPGRMGATYDGIYWDPPAPYAWQHASPHAPRALRIYEAHVGMSGPEPRCATYVEFADNVLPRIAAGGYNTVQLMAIQEHSYYASFGYHVTNFFAVSSRSGSPEDLKYLVDTAHGLGLRVLLDIVHSHASSNKADGLNGYDFGQDSGDSYFHSGERGYHRLWDSRCFRYDNWEVQRFLLSNLHFWLAEYRFDGFRFDGVTSMLYTHHGISRGFSGQYGEYFGYDTDVDAVVYLMLANDLIKRVNPEATVLAEDVSGMPTLCRPVAEGGVGFDARLAMAVPDHWIKLLKERPDHQWGMHELITVLCNRRYTEKAVAYAESHDQALVGDKTIAFWLMDKHMYDGMSALQPANEAVRRGMALHKVIRAVTCVLGGEGYLTFMGNEFGHPEWIDFPREGNGWSHHHCRRRWDLADAEHLRYGQLQAFDRALMAAEEAFKWLSHPHQLVSVAHDGDKLIVAERGDLLWIFNFSGADYSGYAVPAPKPGAYTRVLDSEEPRFGGHGAAGGVAPPVVASPGGPDTLVGPYKQDKRAATLLLDIPRRCAQAYVWCGELPAAPAAA